MTPQFEAACIAAATIMAADQGRSDPTAAAIASFRSFRLSYYALYESVEGDVRADGLVAQNFADWWESLCEEQKEVVCNGEDTTPIGDDDNTMVNPDTGELVAVSNDNHALLTSLFMRLE